MDRLRAQLERDEGRSNVAYSDSEGYATIGVGHRLTIPIPDAAIDAILTADIAIARREVRERFPWVVTLSEPRQGVLDNMTFNMGGSGVAGFRKMLAAARAGDWVAAAREMRDSRWATQVGARAERLAVQMETDTWQ